MPESFPSFPPCCQKMLAELIEQKKTGSRNCEKGHAVNLASARHLEVEMRAKRAAEEAKAKAEEAEKANAAAAAASTTSG
jgi:hypothetical protein